MDSFINLYSSMYGEPIGTVFFKVKEGWDSSQGYYRYGLPSGQYAKKQFVDLGRDQKYYFDKNGKMVTSDWLKADGKWYHAAADGHMDLGWQYLDSEWYYFNDPAGDMKTNGWETFEGKRYFLSNDGACIRNRNEYIDGKNWYFDEDGAASEITIVQGWNQIGNGKKYIFSDNSYATSQFVDLGRNQKYYFNADEWLVTSNWITHKGKLYHAAADGHMDLGWQYLDSEWYYFNDPEGDMKVNGWETFEGKRYYLSSSGARYRNTIQTIDGTAYRFDQDGAASEQSTGQEQSSVPRSGSSRAVREYRDNKQASSSSDKSKMQAVTGQAKPQ
ncbi:N-acetylmuramoyl-L-alanine amidase family protein [Lacrimispora sp. 210928-DFI.3.58]|uniref:N-acetylmuramoyl-L-alanine amidase family protein n=1 Tax=Lacrimispora sp. 210928-DFI.3.58 TaxID=2883214 RepID=UPI001D06EAA5|nr:hypothetical protein [Lacrimispora sp. 210928-DFI.3.58]